MSVAWRFFLEHLNLGVIFYRSFVHAADTAGEPYWKDRSRWWFPAILLFMKIRWRSPLSKAVRASNFSCHLWVPSSFFLFGLCYHRWYLTAVEWHSPVEQFSMCHQYPSSLWSRRRPIWTEWLDQFRNTLKKQQKEKSQNIWKCGHQAHHY